MSTPAEPPRPSDERRKARRALLAWALLGGGFSVALTDVFIRALERVVIPWHYRS